MERDDYEMLTSQDVDRSIRLLDSALSTPRKSLLKISRKQSRKVDDLDISKDGSFSSPLSFKPKISKRSSLSVENVYDNSITFGANEIKKLLSETSSVGLTQNQNTAKAAKDRLFFDFLEIWQTHGSIREVFESILDFVQCCSHTVTSIKNVWNQNLTKPGFFDEKILTEIESERNTWRLIYALYQNRLALLMQQEEENEEEDEENDYFLQSVSEKEIMLSLYKNDRVIRESQLVVDWLEQNASDLADGYGLEQYTDKTIAWENTLHELQSKKPIPYKSSRELITQLDPDAPHREKKALHDLDKEDDDRLIQEVYQEIRRGHLDAAQSACAHAGQSWRAALLEGWRLYHDPNYSAKNNQVQREPLPVEGNPYRDIWKLSAWKMCEDVTMPLKARASLAAYCGHLQTLLDASVSWEDQLWSYLKVSIDAKVEKEIREISLKSYVEMPQLYWNNIVTLEEIFNELQASKNPLVRRDAMSPEHIVQKYLVLDQIPQLMEEVSKWIQGSDMSVGSDYESVSPHFLRFLTHLVLFLRRIGRSECDSVGDAVIEAYVKLLIEMRESKLVAWYVSQLSQEDQIYYYAAFLEEITDSEERNACLKAAQEAGLNVDVITKTVVENIRQQSPSNDVATMEVQPDVSPEDLIKISALDWLLYYPGQRTELLIQTNALIANFLSAGNIQAARLAFNKIPDSTIDLIVSSNVNDSLTDDTYINLVLNNMPKQVSCATKEYLCYKAYLEADESFSDWFQYFNHGKPIEPVLKEGANFSEKVAFQHKYSQYKINYDRWKISMDSKTATTKTLLYNVLLFPMGWLVDDENVEDNDRTVQLSGLRSIVIPKVTFLLHTVMHGMEDYSGCVALSDLIAAEQYKLYKVFSKQKLQDFLSKALESSLELMNQGKDPWGYTVV
ncbi:Nuclear pore complex protein Nup107, putative [Pediculus humanus corporis]|uniref:Nuclear pore complex protein n=1 Tax=Pediculus humanus subsp. corporis TaxID=121224 RepID=E0VBQ0_PEDHC|nr:Nuclear pore complex protein Nup107, putative [Pediculus humanus corporis]EEB10806.1 Nuclear pore complex protein Nup107, putative [Pediculus humanus corporis]